MKKFIMSLIPAIALLLSISSCRDEPVTNPNNNNPNSVQGTWSGTGLYGAVGNPTYAFSLNFKSNGVVDITGNNSTAVDVAIGTWQMVGDSVQATYKYSSSSAIYKLSGKYSVGATSMNGTIGLDPVTSGVGTFTVNKHQ